MAEPTSLTCATLFEQTSASRDRLFLIAYRNPNTLRPRWYLVQVDMIQTECAELHLCPESTGNYYCHFLSEPAADASLPDPDKRWWPLWYRYSTDTDGTLVYGARIEFKPDCTPPASTHIAWADTVNLVNPNIRLLGPFNFQDPVSNAPGRTPSFRQYVPASLWIELSNICHPRGIVPPSFLTKQRANRKRKSKQ